MKEVQLEDEIRRICEEIPDVRFDKIGHRIAETLHAFGRVATEARTLVADGLIEGLYLSSHTPRGIDTTVYRLWTEKPKVGWNGHADWFPETAIAELILDRQTDTHVLFGVGGQAWPGRYEIVRTQDADFCFETRIYKLTR